MGGGRADRKRLRLLAGRVVAVDAMLGGADFIEPGAGCRAITASPGRAASTSRCGCSAPAGSPRMRSTSRASGGRRPGRGRRLARPVLARQDRARTSAGDRGAAAARAAQPPVFRPEFLDRADARAASRTCAPALPFDRSLNWSDAMLIAFFVNDIEREYRELYDHRARASRRRCAAIASATSRRPTSCWRRRPLHAHARFPPKRKYKDRAEFFEALKDDGEARSSRST